MTAAVTPRPARDRRGLYVVTSELPPIQCQPWCRYGDGHPEMLFVEDQHCLSEVPGDEVRDEDDEETALVYARHVPGGQATVELWTRHTAHLTAAQARAFAHAMLAAADLVDQANGDARRSATG